MAGISAVLVKAPEKFPALNYRVTREAMGELGAKLRDGRISPAAFKTAMEREIKSGVTAAYRFQIGRRLNDDDLGRVNTILANQSEHLAGFMKDIQSREPGDWLESRAASYSGSVTVARAEGTLASKEDDDTLEWSGPDGESSCSDCESLIGTSRTVAEWRASGETPGSVACGPNCRCSLG